MVGDGAARSRARYLLLIPSYSRYTPIRLSPLPAALYADNTSFITQGAPME